MAKVNYKRLVISEFTAFLIIIQLIFGFLIGFFANLIINIRQKLGSNSIRIGAPGGNALY